MGRRRASDALRWSAHAVTTLGWALMVPVAWQLGWLESLVFISACSIYANFASHLAAWLADETRRLKRIELKLDKILDHLTREGK